MQAYLRLFFSPYGRIKPPVFRFGWLVLTLVNLVFLGGINSVLGPAFIPAGLVLTLFPTICVYTHRLHDLGRSGWWQTFPRVAIGLPLVFAFVPWLQHRLLMTPEHGGQPLGFIAAAVVLALMLMFVLGILADIGLFGWLALKRGETQPSDVFD